VSGEDFGFDVEVEGALWGEGEDLVEGGDAGVGDGDLFREGGEGCGAAVVLAKLGEGERVNEGPGGSSGPAQWRSLERTASMRGSS
jgi:hypothetical protein